MSASDDVKKLKELIDNPSVKSGGKARYKNKSYSLAELNELLKAAEKVAKKEADARMVESGREFEKQVNLEIQTEKEKANLKEQIVDARINLEVELADLSLALENNGDIPAAQKSVRDAYLVLQNINPTDELLKGVTIPSISRGGREREGGTGPVSNVDRNVADRADQKPAVVATDKTPETTTTTVTTDKTPAKTTATTDTNARKEFVDAELVKRKLEDTPENRAMLRKEYATLPSVVSTDWESAFRAMDPSKAWLLDEDRTKYPQLFALLQKAHDEKYYDTPEGRARFEAELKGVDFYKEIATSGKVREIKKIVGDLGFDSTDFSKFVADSINRGWTGDTLKAETYKEVFRRTPDGTYANPTAVKRATQGNDYLNMQLIAKNYFNEAPQSTIENILTGGITVDDFQRQQRVMAKQRYGHLSELIDQGVTLEDLASNYRQSAAKLLEIDPNQIDMSQGDYEIALSFGEEGKKRAMTTGEWEKLLRTDSRYGWEKTENAKSEARSLASNIAEAFGRII